MGTSQTQCVEIALVGDFDSSVPAHQAIPRALNNVAAKLGIELAIQWMPTQQIDSETMLHRFHGFWCVPASPYRNMEGALRAIQFARERQVPFLATCGGFQHAVIEYARNVLGWSDSEHAETSPHASRKVIAPLSCQLVEKTGTVNVVPNTRLAQAYGKTEITEGYRCRFGLTPQFADSLLKGPLVAVAFDSQREVRAIELKGHPFFVATLFQPERAALKGEPVPLAESFVRACLQSKELR